jgi:predicted RNA-binding Zn ribbon-like protein
MLKVIGPGSYDVNRQSDEMTVRDDFLYIAGEPALDFLNTEIVRDGAPVDLLDDAEALERWLREAGLGRVRVTPAALKGAKRLRGAFREVAGALADGETPKRLALRVIDEELRRTQGALTLRAGDGGLEVAFEPREEDARFLLARAAATFLARAEPARIRRCGGTNCVLFFYDVTKSATRRWCSMAGCGNRMKAALHYQRSKST